MRQRKRKTITDDAGEEHLYVITQLTAAKGMKTLTVLLRAVGAPLVQLLANQEAASNPVRAMVDIDPKNEQAHAALYRLFMNLDDMDVGAFIQQLFQDSDVYRDEIAMGKTNFDLWYAANYGEMFKAFWFILEANYMGTIGALDFLVPLEPENTALPPEES